MRHRVNKSQGFVLVWSKSLDAWILTKMTKKGKLSKRHKAEYTFSDNWREAISRSTHKVHANKFKAVRTPKNAFQSAQEFTEYLFNNN